MRLLFLFSLELVFVSCSQPPSELQSGTWRGLITIQNHELPFTFDVEKNAGAYQVFLKNGDERLLLDDISISGDSVNMPLHIFDAELRAKLDGNKLSGYFIRNYATDYKFPFAAVLGDDFRFVKAASSSVVFDGKYDVRFYSDRDTTVSVGIFSQKENQVTGTFLLEDGDYRYLEGNVVDDEMKLSTFDGNHAYLFTATKKGDTIRGDYYSGKSTHKTWIGIRNDNAKMPDPESLTFLKPGYEKLDFHFPGLDKKMVSLSDEKYRNKVVIVQILGTWCPNCMDETRFLAPWYQKNKDRGVEILGLAYERKSDFDYASNRVKIMKHKMGVDYDIIIAGVNDKEKAASTLPALNKLIGFPTTIFIGKDGKVKKIHTGFSGPGTGAYYDEFIQNFNATIDGLLQENSAHARERK